MKPAARIKATIEILAHMQASPVPMDKTIADYMRGRRYIGSKDRSNIAERVYSIVRAHARLGWWLEKTGMGDTPRGRVLFWLALCELKDSTMTLPLLFDGTKYGPEAPDKGEQKVFTFLADKSLDDPEMPAAARHECPPEHEEVLRDVFGDAFEQAMAAMLENAPLDLRVNLAKQDRESVRDALRKDRVFTEAAPYSVSGLRAEGKAYVAKTKAFIKGWISIQDEGSQLIAQICDAQPGMQVLDYCAGGGGKTLALADAMRGKGRIVATDIDGRRLEKAKPRFKQAGISDMVEVRPLSEERLRKWLKRQKGTFDIVLADAPCSGTGTWRRNPDTRWRHFGPPVEELVTIQAEILDKAARAVKPGGRLVYATCSLLPQENERQVEAFLARAPDFEIVEHDLPYAKGPYMRLAPHSHNTDGFFAAVLRKI